MDALKVTKSGRTYRTGAQTAQALIVYSFLIKRANVQLVKRDIVAAVIYYYTTTEVHYTKHDSHLLAY